MSPMFDSIAARAGAEHTFHVAAVRNGEVVDSFSVPTLRGWLSEAYAEARLTYPEFADCTLVVVRSPFGVGED